MCVLSKVILSTTELDDTDLLAAALPQHFCTDFHSGQKWAANSDVLAFTDEKHFVETDLRTLFNIEFLQLQDFTLARTVLFAA